LDSDTGQKELDALGNHIMRCRKCTFRIQQTAEATTGCVNDLVGGLKGLEVGMVSIIHLTASSYENNLVVD
jgi:hypothetical protein